jgi:hypothetical protein
MNTPKHFPVRPRCSFAYPGTYGHECGAPATQVFVFKAENTRDGLFFTGRCEQCAKIPDGENSGVIRKEPFGNQSNQFY